MTTINDIADLARILRENPEWAEAIRSLVLSRELLELPERFAELTGRVDTIAVQMSELTVRVDTLTSRVDALTVQMTELTSRVDALTVQMTELTSRVDALIVRVDTLTSRVDALTVQMAELTGRVDALTVRVDTLTSRVDALTVQMAELTSRVDALTKRFDEFVELTNRNFELVNRRLDNLESDVGELKIDMAEVKVRTGNLETTMGQVQASVNRVHGRMDNGFGMNYEFKAEKNIRSIVGQQMNVRRARILSGARTGPTSAFIEMIDEAEDAGIITEEQSDEILLLDMVLSGQHRSGAEATLIAAEVSITIGDSDIDRAAERGALLAQACQMPVLTAVVGSRIDEERSALAQARGVSVLITSDD